MVRPRNCGGHGILAACSHGKRAIDGGFIIASSPLLRLVVSAPLASGAGRAFASGWFVQIAIWTRGHTSRRLRRSVRSRCNGR